jgi:hypothetical protein
MHATFFFISPTYLRKIIQQLILYSHRILLEFELENTEKFFLKIQHFVFASSLSELHSLKPASIYKPVLEEFR